MEKERGYSIEVDSHLHYLLKITAYSENTSMIQIIKKALKDFFKKNKKRLEENIDIDLYWTYFKKFINNPF